MTSQPQRAERLRTRAAMDGEHCVWCRRPCTGLVRATTDHLVPRVKGGPSWLENEVVACGRCNRERGHLSPADWIAECERRGWEPDLDAVAGALAGPDPAIGPRGGQPRAPPHPPPPLRPLPRRTPARPARAARPAPLSTD